MPTNPAPSTVVSPRPRRRWFQFRLGTLLIGVTVLAISLGLGSWCRQPVFDIDFKTGQWPETPLGEAAIHGRVQDVGKMLDSKQFEIDEQDGYGRTALHWAAIGGQTAVFDYLVYRGAAIDIRDGFGWQPSDYRRQ